MKTAVNQVIIVLVFTACSFFVPPQDPPSGLLTRGTNTYKLWLPSHFSETAFTQKYPLVISLHGATGSTDVYFDPCIVNNPSQGLEYPCVFFAPNSTAGYGVGESWIREVISELVENPGYRIDRERIYIIGFSMGGFGCTSIARDLYLEYGYTAAALVPTGGGHYPDIPQELRTTTAMWTHYGLAGDFSQESDYQDAMNWLSGEVNTLVRDISTQVNWDGSLVPYPRETRTLSLGGQELFKISTYEGMGHTPGPVYNDPIVLKWLFSRRAGGY